MCGIFAAICLGDRGLPNDTQARVGRALHAIRHRGPDASGSFIDPKGRWCLGHVRLSVLDLSAACTQPFWSKCGRYAIAFNGEVYNYVELREELERLGETFRTTSDTEVLLAALIRWGETVVPRLNGMWAFVFVDIHTGEFLVSRDRWGAKPLHVMERDGCLLLCSEAKGILAWLGEVPKPNHRAIGRYLQYGTTGNYEHAWFEGVKRFPQAHTQRLSLSQRQQQPSPVRYWDYPTERSITSVDDAAAGVRALLTNAVSIRLRSDVPVGISLSGGLDSTGIAALVREQFNAPLNAFTVWHGVKEQSELPIAARIAEQFGHSLIEVGPGAPDKVVEDLRTCVWHLDAAHNSTAIVPYLNLCKEARTRVTVMLEGQGADEVFGGYPNFDLPGATDRLRRGEFADAWRIARMNAWQLGWFGLAADLARFSFPALYRRQALAWGSHKYLTQAVRAAELESQHRLDLSGECLCRNLQLSHRNGLTNLLQYGDALSMAFGLEARCPFLDFRLVELGFALDTRLLLRDGYRKFILRRALDGVLPHEVAWTRRKDGFGNSTIELLTKAMRGSPIRQTLLALAVDLGILEPRCRDDAWLDQLPPNIQYRVYTMLLWLDEFYGARPRPKLLGF